MASCTRSEVFPGCPHLLIYQMAPSPRQRASELRVGLAPEAINTFQCNIRYQTAHLLCADVAQHIHDHLLLQGGRVYSHGGDQGEVGLHQQCQIDEIKINPAFLVFNCHYHKLTLGYFNFKSTHGTRTRPQRPKWPLTSLFVHDANTFLI